MQHTFDVDFQVDNITRPSLETPTSRHPGQWDREFTVQNCKELIKFTFLFNTLLFLGGVWVSLNDRLLVTENNAQQQRLFHEYLELLLITVQYRYYLSPPQLQYSLIMPHSWTYLLCTVLPSSGNNLCSRNHPLCCFSGLIIFSLGHRTRVLESY